MTTPNDLLAAVMADDLERVEALLAANPRLAEARDDRGQSLILLARYRSRLDVLAALLRAQPTLDVFEAAAVGDTARVRELVTADPELVRAYAEDGFTALHLAAFFGHADTTALLLDLGANIAAVTRNDLENQPLHAAAAARHLEVCRLLLERGAPVNEQQHGGYTPLQSAAQHGDRPLVELLLAHGADPTIEGDDGKTAADRAYEFNHDNLAAMLREREAPPP